VWLFIVARQKNLRPLCLGATCLFDPYWFLFYFTYVLSVYFSFENCAVSGIVSIGICDSRMQHPDMCTLLFIKLSNSTVSIVSIFHRTWSILMIDNIHFYRCGPWVRNMNCLV
jgi:hypothetical protein